MCGFASADAIERIRAMQIAYFMKRSRQAIMGCLLATVASVASGQETVTYETGADGVTRKVTRRVSQQLVPTTQMQTREEKVLRSRVTTKYQTYQQSYLSPVTEYRWVSRMRGRWNPFVQPYWAQQLEPVTRWESRAATVQMPTTSTDWVEERRTVQTPVTTYRTVQNETVSRVAVSVAPGAMPSTLQPNTFTPVETPMVASRPAPLVGGQRMQSDPPRGGNEWRNQGTLVR